MSVISKHEIVRLVLFTNSPVVAGALHRNLDSHLIQTKSQAILISNLSKMFMIIANLKWKHWWMFMIIIDSPIFITSSLWSRCLWSLQKWKLWSQCLDHQTESPVRWSIAQIIRISILIISLNSQVFKKSKTGYYNMIIYVLSIIWIL